MRTGASPSLWHRPPEPVTYEYIPLRLRKLQGSRTPQPRVQCGAYQAEPAQREVLLAQPTPVLPVHGRVAQKPARPRGSNHARQPLCTGEKPCGDLVGILACLLHRHRRLEGGRRCCLGAGAVAVECAGPRPRWCRGAARRRRDSSRYRVLPNHRGSALHACGRIDWTQLRTSNRTRLRRHACIAGPRGVRPGSTCDRCRPWHTRNADVGAVTAD